MILIAVNKTATLYAADYRLRVKILEPIFSYILTKGVKSTAAKWWRKEKSVMISDSGGARAEFTEQIAECDV